MKMMIMIDHSLLDYIHILNHMISHKQWCSEKENHRKKVNLAIKHYNAS